MPDKKKDATHEGRDKYAMDVDRMINEGMAGGTVNLRYKQPQIGEYVELEEEQPPHNVDPR